MCDIYKFIYADLIFRKIFLVIVLFVVYSVVYSFIVKNLLGFLVSEASRINQ